MTDMSVGVCVCVFTYSTGTAGVTGTQRAVSELKMELSMFKDRLHHFILKLFYISHCHRSVAQMKL